MHPKTKKFIKIISGLLVIIFVLFFLIFFEQKSAKNLQVIFLDVGQGDSILVKTPSHQEILIDGGPDTSVLNELGRNLSFFDHTINLIILTHPDADHITGLIEVLKRYNVEKILCTGVACHTTLCDSWFQLIKEKNIPIDIAWAGKAYVLGDVNLDILFPIESLEGKEFKNFNDSSIVAKLVYSQTSFFLTGDATVEVEEKILQASESNLDKLGSLEDSACPKGLLKSDVLKVGHHGSQYSTSLEFLQAVQPQYAIIQVGKDNKYGHPHLGTLRRLENLGIKVFRTDLDGEVRFVSDGQKLEVGNEL